MARFFFGGFGANTVLGTSGTDFVFGFGGSDDIDTGAGNDLIFAGSGNDTVHAGSGNDTVFAGRGNDIVYGGEGRDRLFGGSGNDFLDGGAGNDYLSGSRGMDVLFGGSGNDSVYGGSGDDLLYGGSGYDRVFGQSGNDRLVFDTADAGGHRNDDYSGGSGHDTLVLEITAEEFASQAFADDFAALQSYIDGGSRGNFIFDAIALTVRSIEDLAVFINGVEFDSADAGPGDGGVDPDPVAVDDAQSLSENGTATGNVLANDVDADGRTVSLVTDVTAGSLILTADGSYTFDTGSDFDSLGAGESQVVTFTYSIDGTDETATVTLTVTGTNDAPIAGAAQSAISTEDGASVTLDLLDGASDVDNATLFVTLNDALPAGLSLSGSELTLDPSDAAFQSLAAGETLNLTVSFDVEDGAGGRTPQTASFTVTGTNDAPTVAAALTVLATEGDGIRSVGMLQGASDVDSNSVLSIENLSELPAGISRQGSLLVIDSEDAAFDALAQGDVREIVITYDVVDQFGAAAPQSVTFTVTGTNDAPTVAAALTGAVEEDASDLVIDLLDGAADVDNGAALSVTNLSALPDGVSFDGQFVTVDADNAAFQGLAAGEEQLIEITYDVTDHFGASVPQTLSLTITGTNDAPTVDAPLSTAATEDGASVSITLLDGARDVDGDTLSIVFDDSELPAGVTFDGTALTLDPTDASFQALAEGQELLLDFTYTIEDGEGGSVSQTATFTVTGTNDVPTASGAQSEAASEDAMTEIDLLALAGDIDLGDILDVTNVTGLVAGLSVFGSTLTVDGTDPDFQALVAAEEREITLSYDIVDIEGASVAQTTTITITGSNDAPTVTAALSETLSEDAFATRIDLLDGAADADTGAVLSVGLPDGATLPDGFVFDGTDLIVSPRSNAAIQALAAGQTLDIVVEYLISDDQGASVPQTLTLTFDGENDAPRLTQGFGLQEVGVDELFSLTLPADVFVDVDAGDALTLSVAQAGGDPLPEWLSYNPATRTLSGTPDAGDAGGLNVVITATDLSGATRTTTIGFAIGEGVIVGTDDDDDLLGTSGADTFFGGLGNDILTGDGGNDTYVFNVGDGQDTVEDNGSSGTDELVFNDRNLADATFSNDPGSNTYTITFANGDNVQVINGINDSGDSIERVVFDDRTLTEAEVRQILLDTQSTDGDDLIVGTSGAETVDGGLGNDELRGGDGSDSYIFEIGDGQDLVDDDGRSDTDELVFLGRDLAEATITDLRVEDDGVLEYTISFANGDSVEVNRAIGSTADAIEWLVFDDQTLQGQALIDYIIATQATDGDDAIQGSLRNDTIDGGTGDDVLSGGDGSDTYVFEIGDGQDIVDDDGRSDTDALQFVGRNFADATFTDIRREDDGTLEYTISFANGDSVEVNRAISSTSDQIERLIFENITLTGTDLYNAVIASQITEGDDTVLGTLAANTLEGGTGNDTLSGGDGSDSYVFNVGDGQDIVDDQGNRDTDVIRLNGRNSEDANIVRVDGTNDYIISFADGDSVTVIGGLGTFGDADAGRIEQVVFDDQTLDITQIFNRVLQDAATDVADTLTGTAFAETLTGGLGNDMLIGGDGSDLYVFNIGDGQDTVEDNGFGDTDVLQFVGRNLADASFEQIGNDFTVTFANGDSVTVISGLFGAQDRIEQLLFDDGPINVADIEFPATEINGTETGDVLPGGNGDDSINGLGGDDILSGNDGNDTIDGGTGDDEIIGGDGNDTLIGGTGNDDIDGGSGDDVLNGGTGDDLLAGGLGADRYTFAEGDGTDTVRVSFFSDEDDVVEFTDRELAEASFVRGGSGVSEDFSDLIVEFANGDQVTIRGFFSELADIAGLIFTDQAVTRDALVASLIAEQITTGDDIVQGTNADEVIEAGAGDDILNGSNGDDTYVYNAGDGNDVIRDSFGSDTIDFTTYNVADATITTNGPNITFNFADGGSVTIEPEVSFGPEGLSTRGLIENFVFADQTLNLGDVLGLSSPADPLVLVGTGDDETLTGDGGNDTLTGGGGDDLLQGEYGDDLYIYNAGDGADIIADASGDDTVQINGYASTDATFSEGPNGLLIEFGNGDSIMVEYAGLQIVGGPIGEGPIVDGEEGPLIPGGPVPIEDAPTTEPVETFIFDDVTLTFGDILDIIDAGVPGEDIVGTGDPEELVGTVGNDTIDAGDGNDRIEGGEGNDTMEGGAGDDTFVYTRGDGNDVITDSSGTDTLLLRGLSERDLFVQRTVIFDDVEGPGQPAFLIEVFDEISGQINSITVLEGSIEFVGFEVDPRDPDSSVFVPIEDLVLEGPVQVAEPARADARGNSVGPTVQPVDDAGNADGADEALDAPFKSEDRTLVSELPGSRMSEAAELDVEFDLLDGISGTAENGMAMLVVATEMVETDFAVFADVEDDAGLF